MVAVGSVWLRKGERAGDIKNAWAVRNFQFRQSFYAYFCRPSRLLFWNSFLHNITKIVSYLVRFLNVGKKSAKSTPQCFLKHFPSSIMAFLVCSIVRVS